VLTSETVPLRSWCFFKSDSRPFAIGVEAVAEVVEADRLVRLSLCPPQILGLCNVRRDIVPVLSLTSHVADDGPDADNQTVVLIVHSDQGGWGIRIDREGTAVADGVLDEAYEPGQGRQGPAIVGTLRRGGVDYEVIDPTRTWRNVRENVEAWYRK
jgi:purine-binding chemotaxis protein CheW